MLKKDNRLHLSPSDYELFDFSEEDLIFLSMGYFIDLKLAIDKVIELQSQGMLTLSELNMLQSPMSFVNQIIAPHLLSRCMNVLDMNDVDLREKKAIDAFREHLQSLNEYINTVVENNTVEEIGEHGEQ